MSTNPRAPRWRRVITTLSLTAIALVAGAGVASAHVSVNPSEASAGGFTKLTFRVPNESPTAGTVGLTIALPTDSPFAFVSVKAVPGWSVAPTKTTLPEPITAENLTIKDAVTSVTWTAQPGTQIAPGEFAEFEISAGPVPDVHSMTFPATQTYSDGKVVEWNEPMPASGEEPEHPVPTLTIASADASAATHGTATVETGAQPVNTAFVSSDTSSTPTVLAVLGLVVAAAALLVAAVALRRRPADTGTPPQQG